MPTGHGFRIDPKLPSDWPELTVGRIHLHDMVLSVTAKRDAIDIVRKGPPTEPFLVHLPDGEWQALFFDENGGAVAGTLIGPGTGGRAHELQWKQAAQVRLVRR